MIIKGLLGCALVCGAPLSAVAGERDRPILPDVRALLAHVSAVRAAPPGRRAPAPRPPAFVRLNYGGVSNPTSSRAIALPAEAAPLASRFAISDLRTPRAWQLTTALPQVTSTRGGDWAVRDTLNDYRKPRYRGSALGTMLVLKIDGEDESPAFSVGGGGVAAALWKVSR